MVLQGRLVLVTVVLLLAGRAACSDYYDLLHVSRHADAAQIKRAYRKVALKYHPDKVEGGETEKEAAAAKFAEISHAYEVLTDPEKKEIYDRYGEDGLKQHGQGGGGSPGGFNPNDIFSRFFGGGGGGRFGFGGGGTEEEQTPKGASVHMDVRVTLEEAYTGTSVEMVRDRGAFVSAPGTRKCRCRTKVMTQQVGPGMYQQYQTQVCEDCPNVRLERRREPLTLHVDPGVPNGHLFSFFEEGEPMVDGEAGDLILRVLCEPHPVFERRGDGLLANVTISLLEALVGFDRDLAHLDGHTVPVGVREGVTKPGEVRWFKGEGMPKFGEVGRGDLWVTYDIVFPSRLDDRQRELAEQMLAEGVGAHEEL